MRFTTEYPYAPPSFRFVTREIHHPNVYIDGRVCISILHTPGDDEQSGEQACERWSPLQGVESVLRSILLLLDEPEVSSPANVDAGVLFRTKRAEYDARARKTAAASRKDIPSDVVFPTAEDLQPKTSKISEDDDFLNESEGIDGFGSESDGDFDFDDYDDDDVEDEHVHDDDEDEGR